MKDFWKFMGKLFLAVTLIVLVIVLVKKFKKSDPVDYDEDEIVYHYPKSTAIGRLSIKNDDFSASGSSPSNEKFSRQFETAYNNLTKQLKKVNDKVNSQDQLLNRVISQTNGSLANMRDKINVLNKTLYRHLEGKTPFETTTAESKERDDIFPFAPLDNSCYEPFNDHPNTSRYAPSIPSTPTKDTTNKNSDIGDNKLTPATCILILRKPSVPFDNKISLKGPSDEYRLSIAGVVATKATEFIVDICIDTSILLHINPKFDENQIIVNSQDSYWDTSKKAQASLDGMVPGHKFQITVTLQKNIFQIEVNNGAATLFQNRNNDTTSVERNVRIRGDVYLNLLTFEILDKPDNESASNSSISNSLLSPFGL